MAHHSLPSCGITVTLTLTVCTFFKNLDLNDVIVVFWFLMQCRPCLMSIKLQDDFNLHSRVAQRVFRILFVALGRKKIVHYWAKKTPPEEAFSCQGDYLHIAQAEERLTFLV